MSLYIKWWLSGVFWGGLLNDQGFCFNERTVTPEKAAKKQQAGRYACDDFIWTAMSWTICNQTLSASYLLSICHWMEAPGKVLLRAAGSVHRGKASLSGLVMQADKWLFILDHAFWQDCWSGVAATTGTGKYWKWLQAEKSPAGGCWGGGANSPWKGFLDLSLVSFECEKCKVKSKFISRTWCNKEVTMAISHSAQDWGKNVYYIYVSKIKQAKWRQWRIDDNVLFALFGSHK